MRFNRSDDAWDELTRAGVEFLEERARLRRVTTYTEMNTVLSRRTGQPPFDFHQESERAAMGELLGRIVDETWDRDEGLMISALVHYLDQNDAGPGFYNLAAQRGLLPKGAGRDVRLAFWISQVNGIHEKYADARSSF